MKKKCKKTGCKRYVSQKCWKTEKEKQYCFTCIMIMDLIKAVEGAVLNNLGQNIKVSYKYKKITK